MAAGVRQQYKAKDALLERIARYWSENLHDMAIATHDVGTREFFDELDEYHFDKQRHLERVIDYSSFAGKKLLDVGCGVGIDLMKFARAGAQVTGIGISQRAIELARSLDDLMYQVTASFVTAWALAAMGQRQEAQRLAEAMLAPAENLRSFTPLGDALWMNATLCRSVGNWQDARRFLERNLAFRPETPRANSDLAILNYQVGDLVQGDAHIAAVLENPPSGVT